MRSWWIMAASLAGITASPAAAICDANYGYSFLFNNAANATLSYTGNYSYTATNPAGASQSFGVGFAANGLSSSTVQATVAGTTSNYQLPRISNIIVGTVTTAKTLTVGGTFAGRTTSITSGTRTIAVTLTFATPVRDLALSLHDFDYVNDQYRDWLQVSGANGASTYTPVMTGPYGNNNSTTPTATNSTVRFGPLATPVLTTAEAVGVGSAANNTDNGDVNISFAQPVTSVTIRYGNFPLQTGESQTGQQFMGISAVRFCPMPNVTIAKSSAPYVTTGANRFAIPGADMAYSLTVTNSGGSPVDIGSLVLTDPLPANVTFYNGDYDSASPGMGPIQLVAGSSGVTLPSSGINFSTDGSTYSGTAVAGYTAAVRYLRLTPTGSLAANSSVTFRFRARVN